MKGILKFGIFIFVLSFNVMFLKADCEEAKIDANAVYETVLNLHTEEVLTVRTRIHNMTSNTYVVVTNDYDNSSVTYHYSDVGEDGIILFDSLNINYNINYVIKVYTEDTSCGVEPVKTINVKTAKYNELSKSEICRNPYDIEMCGAFYDVGDMKSEEFIEKVQALIDEETGGSKTLVDYIKKYYLFVLIPILLIIIVYGVRIIILKRGKKND